MWMTAESFGGDGKAGIRLRVLMFLHSQPTKTNWYPGDIGAVIGVDEAEVKAAQAWLARHGYLTQLAGDRDGLLDKTYRVPDVQRAEPLVTEKRAPVPIPAGKIPGRAG